MAAEAEAIFEDLTQYEEQEEAALEDLLREAAEAVLEQELSEEDIDPYEDDHVSIRVCIEEFKCVPMGGPDDGIASDDHAGALADPDVGELCCHLVCECSRA